MSTMKLVGEFQPIPASAKGRCWQIDNDELPSPLDDGEWETHFAHALVDLAKSQDSGSLTCLTDSGPSADFGRFGFSVWVTLVGAGPLLKAASEVLLALIPPQYIRPAASPTGAHRTPRIRVQDGCVWIPYDDAYWAAVDSHELDVGDMRAGSVGDYSQVEGASKAPKRRKALNAARDAVTVGYYQHKIERMLSLPEGSVKLVNPDRSIAHPTQLVGTLRRRWEGS